MSFPASKAQTVKPKKARGKRRLESQRLQMTSLIDILTCLCLFLLQSFSAENQIVTETKNLVLPESSATKIPELMVTLKINNQTIMAEDKVVADVREALESNDLIIPGLYQWLGDRRVATEKISQYSTKTKFKGDVNIQADKRVRFRLLKKIMYTCGQQGYNNFSLAVRQKG